MKLLKYVMTSDSGLAPNPYFDVCSLALCTPNHMNAKLKPGDWIVGHSCKATGHRLVYAMRLTKVLGMDEYFRSFPDKHPEPGGSVERQYGDNMYFREDGRWARLPSAEHNSEASFRQDRGRPVYLAEHADSFWYFGADNAMPELQGFADKFPWLIHDRHGIRYIHDTGRIQAFAEWLLSLEGSGLLGKPRDQTPIAADGYLTAIDPERVWLDGGADEDPACTVVSRCTRRVARPRGSKRSC